MNPDRWQQIDDLLVRTLELAPDERSGFLAAQTRGDSDLRREVRSLLEASEREDAFIDQPALGGVARLLPAEDEDPGTLVGKRLGPYRVEAVIATGGMGAVCLGVRDDDAFTMRVAIKLVRRGAGGSSGDWHAERLRRFHLERQVLAELEHPSIARLIDGGTDEDGRPYLVMEHVDGVPVDAYCERAGLDLHERLRLFVSVCRAVQHAHQRLIIHRDLKPSNILVTPDGRPKLLDFGLAKMLNPHRAALRSAHTQAGQFMGTVAYAAPEQVAGSAREQDVRTDVYALGMILYRLVAGRHAYPIDGSMSDVLDRITRVMPGPPSGINPRVGRELDTIVLKALAKDRDRRYQSAAELGDDVERLLAGEPVLARGTSRWYLVRKAAARHRLALSTVAGVVMLIVVFAGVMTWQAASLADRSAALASALRTSNIERARTLGANGSVTEAEQILWDELLASIPGDPTPANLTTGDRNAYWALRELYSREPCRWSTRMGWKPNSYLRFSPGGDRALLWREGEPARLVDTRTNAAIAELQPDAWRPSAACFSPDADAAWFITPDGTLSRWRFADTRAEPILETGLRSPEGLRAAPDGRLLVCAGTELAVIDPASARVDLRIPVPTARVRDAAMTPDGSVIAAAADDGHVRLYDAHTGDLLDTLLDPERWTSILAFSPDGRYLATDVNGADVAIIDMATRAVAARLTDTAGWISSLRFHPERTDPPILLASSIDKSAYAWEIPSGRLVRRFGGHDSPLYDAAFSPPGDTVVTLGNGVVRAWDLEPGGDVTRWREPGTVFDAKFTPDGRRLVTASGDRRNVVTVRDAADGRVERVLPGHDGAVTSLALTPDGLTAVTGSYDGTVREWSLDPGEREPDARVIVPHDSAWHVINCVDLSPDGALVAASSDDGMVRIWRRSDGSLVEAIRGGSERVPSVRFSPDGRWVAMAVTRTNELVLHDRRDGREITLPGHTQTARIVRFSPDGELLASAGDDLMIRLWSMKPGHVGRLERELAGHRADVFALAFSPDGTLLASSGRGGDVKLWDVPTGRCLVTFHPHDDMVFTLAFSPDGRTLVSAGRDGAIALCRLDYYDAHLAGNLGLHLAEPQHAD